MIKPSPYNCFFITLWLFLALVACHQAQPSLTIKQSNSIYNAKVKQLITAGKRVESVNNDSLKIIAKQLYQLNKLSGDNTALVYAELFETNYYWQAANHQKAMQTAITCLGNAEKFNVRQALPQIYAVIANLHKETTNYNMAFNALEKGLNAAVANKDTASIIALLGLKAMFTRGLSLNHHDPEVNDKKSIALNLAALDMAESNPKYERLRIRFYDNIAQFYKDKRDFEKTFYYGNKGVALAVKYDQQRSLTYGYCWLGQAYYYKGQQAKGIILLNKALQIATDLKEPYRVMEINGAMYDCYISSNNYKEALKYNNRYRVMRDSLKVLDNVKQISELQLKYEAVKKDKEISSLNANDQIKTIQRNAIVIVLILLIVIVALIYVKEKKRKNVLIKEKLLVDEDLRVAELELLHFTESLQQKNELIENFKAEIEQMHLQHITAADRESLENLIKAHIMTDENWDSFKKLFTKVHRGFFSNLKKRFPHLTATDIRMLSLVKLQLSNNEMANMLGITIEGIKKSKQRLRKKMNLNQDESIEVIIANL